MYYNNYTYGDIENMISKRFLARKKFALETAADAKTFTRRRRKAIIYTE